MQVEVWDYDVFTANDLVGLTTIDLEDRWFDEKWHDYGKELQSPTRLRPVPLETRSLWSPKSNSAQVGTRCSSMCSHVVEPGYNGIGRVMRNQAFIGG
jgi:hypothetical protein